MVIFFIFHFTRKQQKQQLALAYTVHRVAREKLNLACAYVGFFPVYYYNNCIIYYLQFKSLATVLLLPIKRSNSNQKFTYPPGLCDPDYTRGNGKSKFLIIPFIRILVVNFDQGEKSAIRREQDNTTS